MLPLLPAILSGGLGLLGGLTEQGSQTERIEEKYNRDANAQLKEQQAANAQINPNAALAQSRQDITSTRDAAIGQALSAAAGSTASSGEFGSNMAKAIRGSQAAQAAGAQYSGQLAQANAQAEQQKAQKVQQGTNIANSTANLSNHVSYRTRQSQNPYANILQGLQGGINTGTNIYALLNNKDFTTSLADMFGAGGGTGGTMDGTFDGGNKPGKAGN